MGGRTVAAVVGGLAGWALVLGVCGPGSARPGPPSAYLGTVVSRPVPAAIADLRLTDDRGQPTSLGALHGQIVVLADFSPCARRPAPLTTGNLLNMDRAVMASRLVRRVRFVELTVDPNRDTPDRLAAYRRLVGAPANWSLLTGSPDTIASIWRYFGVWFQTVPEPSPPGRDWLTGRPLTYDVNHEDALVYIDEAGSERFLVVGSPDATGSPVASACEDS